MSRPKNAAIKGTGTVREQPRKDSAGSRADRRAHARECASREERKAGLSDASRPPEVEEAEPVVTMPVSPVSETAPRVRDLQAALARLADGKPVVIAGGAR